MKSSEMFWLDNPYILFNNMDLAVKFIPQSSMSLDEQLNASLRFSVYFSTLIFIARQDPRVLFFIVFVALFTILIKKNDDKKLSNKKQVMEKLDVSRNKYGNNLFCELPTKDNPFMNVMLSDHKNFPNRPPACNVTNDAIKKMMENKFDNGTFRDIDDIYGRKTSSRPFYTMPSTTIPNDQKLFAESLYMTKPPNKATGKQIHNGYYRN